MEILKSKNRIKGEKPDVDSLINDCCRTIDNAIATTWNTSTQDEYLQELANQIGVLIEGMLRVGDNSYEELDDLNAYTLQHAMICYQWGEYVKAFSLLWRDITFEHQYANLRLYHRAIQENDLQNLKEQSFEVISKAASEIRLFFTEGLNKIATPQKQLETWKLEDNPWPTYKQQVLLIPDQCKKLKQQSVVLLKTAQVYNSISDHFKNAFVDYSQNLEMLKVELNNFLQSFKEEEDFGAGKVVKGMESVLTRFIGLGDLSLFNDKLNRFLFTLPKEERFCIEVSNGNLLYKEIDLQTVSRSWLESEVMSEVYNLFTIQEQVQNKISLSIVNIRNKVNLEEQEEASTEKKEIEQSLGNFIKNLEKTVQKVLDLQKVSENEFQQFFNITRLYEDSFLSRSLQYTIQQYHQSRRKRWAFLQKWFDEKGSLFRQFQKNVRQEESLSTSEKIVRAVKHRTPDQGNSQYTNIFLTEGWIGDSFVVGRDEELDRMANLIENWELGFRGDVLITGLRLSGKTLFGQLVNHRFFDNKAIELTPGKKIQVAGRQFETSHNLGEALDFVLKYTLNTQTMIWIDDLELWTDDKITLSENVKKLLATIDQYTGRLFFVVSMSNWLKAHLHRTFEIDKVFQCEINLDDMTSEEVEQSIFIRHGATHIEFVNDKEEDITSRQFRKFSNQAYRQSNGSIGAALHQWVFMTRKYNDEKIVKRSSAIAPLPDFVSMESGLLLQAIMMEKKTNEFRLSKTFGPAFQNKYKVLLQRLINLGILKRSDSWLEINPFLANDVGRQLAIKMNFHLRSKKENEKNIKL